MNQKMQVEVLGPGCPRCVKAEQVVRSFIEESGLDVELSKVESFDRMLELGAMATPAIAVNGELKMVGQIPKPAQLRKLFGLEG